VEPGIVLGLIGPNGAGKTTLFRMIVGQEKPDAGALRVGDTVVPAYVDQSRDSLDGGKTVFEEMTGGAEYLVLGKRRIASRSWRSAVRKNTSRRITSERLVARSERSRSRIVTNPSTWLEPGEAQLPDTSM